MLHQLASVNISGMPYTTFRYNGLAENADCQVERELFLPADIETVRSKGHLFEEHPDFVLLRADAGFGDRCDRLFRAEISQQSV